ncbi:MAG: hypothetical protein Q9211_007099, partial [Gyalolechia sp. 1 TL-2023]
IESHKRENRRLTVLIDQQKDDAARLTVRLSGTEKQRDDALEALVLQQDIAEELERERKRNQKELAALKHTNASLLRQRDESQRVVLHLRSLINGQTHHMEHIVRSLNQTPEIPDYTGEDFDTNNYSDIEDGHSVAGSETVPSKRLVRAAGRTHSRASTTDENGADLVEGENVTPEMETHFFNPSLNPQQQSGRTSRVSIAGVADRHLRDKTDAIADIIRNISEQCAAAVEGLQLAHDAEHDDEDDVHLPLHGNEPSMTDDDTNDELHKGSLRPSQADHPSTSSKPTSEADDSSSLLHPSDGATHSRTSSIPPTPDLVPHNRSSTSMSMASASTNAQDRSSGSYATSHNREYEPKILELEEGSGDGSVQEEEDEERTGAAPKHNNAEFIRPVAAGRVGR